MPIAARRLTKPTVACILGGKEGLRCTRRHRTYTRKPLVDSILRGKELDSPDALPSIDAFSDHLRDALKMNATGPSHHDIAQAGQKTIIYPICIEEAEKAKMGWHTSGPGPDGIPVNKVRNTSNVILAALYSLCILSGHLPPSF